MSFSDFICPECGSQQSDQQQLVETEFSESDPWSAVLERFRCARCHFIIPAHLAERWNGLTLEQARQRWRETYRSTAPED